jgi:hypothetical protein
MQIINRLLMISTRPGTALRKKRGLVRSPREKESVLRQAPTPPVHGGLLIEKCIYARVWCEWQGLELRPSVEVSVYQAQVSPSTTYLIHTHTHKNGLDREAVYMEAKIEGQDSPAL